MSHSQGVAQGSQAAQRECDFVGGLVVWWSVEVLLVILVYAPNVKNVLGGNCFVGTQDVWLYFLIRLGSENKPVLFWTHDRVPSFFERSRIGAHDVSFSG